MGEQRGGDTPLSGWEINAWTDPPGLLSISGMREKIALSFTLTVSHSLSSFPLSPFSYLPSPSLLLPPLLSLCRIILKKKKRTQQNGSWDAVVAGVDVIYFPQLVLWKPGVDRAVL